MVVLALAGRILFSFMFLQSGINHVRNQHYMTEYAGQMGVPAPAASVVASGVVIFTGAAMIIAGVWGDLGAFILAGFLVLTAVQMHPYWKMQNPEMKQNQHINFWKNISMAGGALALAAWFLCAPGTLAVTSPLLSRWFHSG